MSDKLTKEEFLALFAQAKTSEERIALINLRASENQGTGGNGPAGGTNGNGGNGPQIGNVRISGLFTAASCRTQSPAGDLVWRKGPGKNQGIDDLTAQKYLSRVNDLAVGEKIGPVAGKHKSVIHGIAQKNGLRYDQDRSVKDQHYTLVRDQDHDVYGPADHATLVFTVANKTKSGKWSYWIERTK